MSTRSEFPGTAGFASDLRATLRALLRRPAFSLTGVATVALGVAASTSMFGAVDAILLRPLPYASADRLVAVMPQQFVANRELEQLRLRTTTMDEVGIFSPGWLMPLIGIPEPRQVNAATISGNFFTMFGVRPLLGTVFERDTERPGQGLVAVLGYDLWRDSFGGDSAIVGRSIGLNGSQYRVLGVMPRGFQLLDWQSDLWVPMTMTGQGMTWTGAMGLLVGRMRGGVTVNQAQADVRAIVPGIVGEFTLDARWGQNARVIALRDSLVGNVSRMLWLLFGAVVVLLLIASSNLANLLLVRATERRHEISVRRSLGAPIGRVARLLVVESLAIGTIGGIVGLGLAAVMLRALPGILPPDVPRLGEVALNLRVLGFALVVTMVPALLVALAPLLQLSGGEFGAALRAARGSSAGARLRGGLVALQVALALVLLVGASLMGRSMVALLSVDRGLRTDHLLTASVMANSTNGAAAGRAFWRQAIQSIEGIPGVVSAGTLLHLPTAGRTWSANVEVEGRAMETGAVVPRSAWQAVSTGYFATAGIPIVEGRAFLPSDDAAAPRVIAVNRAFANRFFPGESPLGRRVTAGNATVRQPATIVAVVGGIRHDSLSAPPAPEVYVPIEQTMVWATGLVVRTTVDPVSVAATVRERIWAIDANVPVTNVRSMDEVFSASLSRPRMILTILGFLAGVGLVLGAIGIYGVVAFGVQQRLRELGIRAALGADASSLRTLVVRTGVWFAVLGVAAGVPVALALGGAMRGLVYGVPTADPASFVVVAILLVGVAALASWWPARAASRSDPIVVLRND